MEAAVSKRLRENGRIRIKATPEASFIANARARTSKFKGRQMIGFWLVNLLPPNSPADFELTTPAGVWEFSQAEAFVEYQSKVSVGACANTYSMAFGLPSGATRLSKKDQAFHETLPICLAFSFVTGMAVTIRNSLPASEISFIQVGPHFPRERGLAGPNPCVSTFLDFAQFVERFAQLYGVLNPTEKLLLLMHHYIDSMSFWSLEDLYLSGSTLLQIIASTEEDSGRDFARRHAVTRTGRPNASPAFFDYLAGAADRVGIAPLQHDVVKIRNSLIHEGTLKQPLFPDQVDAAAPIADAMQWIDRYVYAVLKLGVVPTQRHQVSHYANFTNSFSF